MWIWENILNVYMAYRILLTIPVITVFAIFFKLKLIKILKKKIW